MHKMCVAMAELHYLMER